jgi:hypothetical protein
MEPLVYHHLLKTSAKLAKSYQKRANLPKVRTV